MSDPIQQVALEARTYCRECGDEAVASDRECCKARVRETMRSLADIAVRAIDERNDTLASLERFRGSYVEEGRRSDALRAGIRKAIAELEAPDRTYKLVRQHLYNAMGWPL